MKPLFALIPKHKGLAVPIVGIAEGAFPAWFKRQPATVRRWLESSGFKAAQGAWCAVPDAKGGIGMVAVGLGAAVDIWSFAALPLALPEHVYALEGEYSSEQATQLALGWALGAYRFRKYKPPAREPATLLYPKLCDAARVERMADAVYLARDLINTPANDLDTTALAQAAKELAERHGARVRVLSGDALLERNYPLIHAVGKASAAPPHLVDFSWGKPASPKVTLVGKGVCFDSGGLDIKSSSGMKLMKKDMGGAACVLALAQAIMAAKLPVRLRVLLPIVENAVAGNAMRPLDVIRSRKGITVEIGNTDAEGRLILCDALFEADSETPDLLIDCATLTGAARVALGAEIPAFFTSNDVLAETLAIHARQQHDPLWRLPLWPHYRAMLDSQVADLSNDPDNSYGGAITAALYLQEFVSRTASWVHVDMMAWNLSAKPGRPQGGEAMAVRALFALIEERYGG